MSSTHQAVARGVVEEIEEEIKELELLPLPLQKLRPLDWSLARPDCLFQGEEIKGLACSCSAFASVLKPEKGHSCVQLVMGT